MNPSEPGARLGTMMNRVNMPLEPQGAHERKRKMEIIGFFQGDEGDRGQEVWSPSY